MSAHVGCMTPACVRPAGHPGEHATELRLSDGLSARSLGGATKWASISAGEPGHTMAHDGHPDIRVDARLSWTPTPLSRAEAAAIMRSRASRAEPGEAAGLIMLAGELDAEPLDVVALVRSVSSLFARVAAIVCTTALASALLDRVTRDPRELTWTAPNGREVRIVPREGETWRFTTAGPVRVEGPR